MIMAQAPQWHPIGAKIMSIQSPYQLLPLDQGKHSGEVLVGFVTDRVPSLVRMG